MKPMMSAFSSARRVLALLLGFAAVAASFQPATAKVKLAGGPFCGISSAAGVAGRMGERSPPSGVYLVVNKEVAKPGGDVKARLLNFDDKTVSYGAEFKIQRRSSNGWTTDPISPAGPWPRSLAKLHPGMAGRCFTVSLAIDQRDGRYRFVTKIGLNSRQEPRTAEFRVARPHPDLATE